MLREFQEEIARLKAELAASTATSSSSNQAAAQLPEQLVQRVVERKVCSCTLQCFAQAVQLAGLVNLQQCCQLPAAQHTLTPKSTIAHDKLHLVPKAWCQTHLIGLCLIIVVHLEPSA